MSNQTDRSQPNSDTGEGAIIFSKNLKVAMIDPWTEVFRSINKNTIPIIRCSLLGCAFSFLVLKGYDAKLFARFGIQGIKIAPWLKFLWGLSWTLSGYYFWGMYRMVARRKMLKKLQDTFQNSSIQNKIGHFPKFIDDRPIDELRRRLRVTSEGIPIGKFQLAKDHLETNLDIEISAIKHPDGKKSFVDIIYGTDATPSFWCIENISDYKDFSFPVGKNQNGEIRTSLMETPHLLVAGISGSGKSSFIRMMTAVLKFNNEDLDISFLDLKGGMESQIFDGFDGIKTFQTVSMCENHLTTIAERLFDRKKLIAESKCKDIESFNKKQGDQSKRLSRHLVIIDEAAELAIKIGDSNIDGLKKINQHINQIARLGRACGIHLVIGTQKPDARNLDTTIKANLSGVLCFYVINHTQSIVILGNKRAADLDGKVRGRAIWQQGSYQEELQTPHLTEAEVQEARNDFDLQKSIEGEKEKNGIKEYYQRSNPYRYGLQNSEVPVEMESGNNSHP